MSAGFREKWEKRRDGGGARPRSKVRQPLAAPQGRGEGCGGVVVVVVVMMVMVGGGWSDAPTKTQR